VQFLERQKLLLVPVYITVCERCKCNLSIHYGNVSYVTLHLFYFGFRLCTK